MEISFVEALIAIAIVAVGAAIQASVGFGLAMIAAPLLLLVNRAFVPAPVIIIALVLVVWMTWKERAGIDRSLIKFGLAGRLLGTPPAALLLGVMSAAMFDIVFALLVLLAVLLSLVHGKIQPTGKAVFVAAIASGFMSTISSIGGPPIALVFQNEKGERLRSNLSVFFLQGCVFSLTALWLIGRLTWHDFVCASILLVGVGLGILLSSPLKLFLDKRSLRPWLLGLCSVSALLVLIRAWLIW